MAILSHKNHELPLGGRLTVSSVDLPAIDVFVHICGAHIDHRLNGEDHARHKHHSGSLLSGISDPGILMEFQADAVSANLLDNRKAIRDGVVIDGLRYIAEVPKGPDLL